MGLAIALLGISGLFERVVRVIPQSVALAVLGGLLLKYGIGHASPGWPTDPLIVLAMIAAFLVLRRIKMRVPITGALLAGFVVAFALGQLPLDKVSLNLAAPVVVWPVFSLPALLGLGAAAAGAGAGRAGSAGLCGDARRRLCAAGQWLAGGHRPAERAAGAHAEPWPDIGRDHRRDQQLARGAPGRGPALWGGGGRRAS